MATVLEYVSARYSTHCTARNLNPVTHCTYCTVGILCARPNDLQAHTKRQIAIQKNMKSDTQQRLEDWHKQAEAHAAEQERAAAKLLYDAEELKRKSEAAQQRAALARSRAAELKKQILSPANADVCVIAPPNPTEKGQLFSKYASSIQEPTKEGHPKSVRGNRSVKPAQRCREARLFAKPTPFHLLALQSMLSANSLNELIVSTQCP